MHRFLCICTALLLPCTHCIAQAQAVGEQRLRVGLALSGGGARGSAHVGVLRVLEELHVPIDCIAGTSMGAIVGGLYASGLSPDEIERLFVEMDWNRAFTDNTPRKQLSFRRKEDEQRYPFDFEVGIRGGRILGPSGLISGQRLDFILRSAVLHVRGDTAFDKLQIPYRAVCTDIDSGDAVVLAEGDLASAMRASMSIPGVFTPVELDGRRLIDGGVVNNLPVDVVREMGADVVIAVDVRPGLGWRGASDSVMSISAQAIEIAIRSMDKEQAAKADLLIRPKLEGHHAADFKQSPRLIALGAKSARVHSGELGQLAVPEHAYAQWLDRQREGPRQEEVRIDFVEIAGNREVATALIKERIKLEAGDALDLACVQYDLGQIYGLGEFERVRFDLVVTNGQTGVVYRAEEKPWGPNYLHFGLHLEDDFEGNSTYSVLLNFTKRRLNSLGGEWRTDLTLGKERSLFSELYQPVDYAGRFFLAASAEGALVREDLYDGNRRIAEYEIEAVAAGLDAGVQLGRFGEARFGVRRGNVTAEVDVGAEVLPSYDVPIGAMVGQLTIDRLDSVSMPRDGMRLEVAWWGTRDALGGEGEYDKLGIMGGAFASYGDLTFFTEGGVGTALGSEVPDYDQFTLGGFFSLAGYGEGQLRGSYVGTGTLGLYYKFLDLPPGLGRGIYAGVKFDAGNAWQTRKEAELDDLRYAGAVFLGADTALGPMYLGYGRAEQNLDRYYFSLGRPF